MRVWMLVIAGLVATTLPAQNTFLSRNRRLLESSGGTPDTTVRAAASNTGNSSSPSVTAPAGTVAGDVVIVTVVCNGNITIVDNNGATPFTEDLNDYQETTTGMTLAVFSRRIQAGDPSTYNFTAGATARWSAIAVTFKNPHPTIIYDVTPSVGNSSQATTGTTGATLAITTQNDKAIHVSVCGPDGNGNLITAKPSGYTEQATTTAQNVLSVHTKIITPAADTGTTSYTWTSSDGSVRTSFAIRNGSSTATLYAPTVVQHVSTSSTATHSITATTGVMRIPLAEPTQAGNCLLLMAQGGATTPNADVRDDQTNAWTKLMRADHVANNQYIWAFAALNIKTNTKVVYFTNLSGSIMSDVSVALTEFNNVATASALDGTNGNFATSTSITAGNITPGILGDLIYQYGCNDSGTHSTASYTAGNQTGITWTKLSSDLQDGMVAQWGVYSLNTVLNPTCTQGTSRGFISAAVALKTASAGSPRPAGMRVAKVLHESQPVGIANTTTLEFPTIGNLALMMFSSGNVNFYITNVTDTIGNTWVESSGGKNSGNGHITQSWYSTNATASSTNVTTVKYNNTASADATIMFYDIVQANIDPYDTRSTSNGTQAVALPLVAPPTLTPSVANGLVFAEAQQSFNTETNISVSGAVFDSIYWDGEQLDGPSNLDQNGGWMHYHNPDTSAIAFTWYFRSASQALQGWTSEAVSFKP